MKGAMAAWTATTKAAGSGRQAQEDGLEAAAADGWGGRIESLVAA